MKIRPDRLTKEVLGDVGVRRGERALAWAEARSNAGTHRGPAGSMNLLVATTVALYLPADTDGVRNRQRWWWDQVLGATWENGEMRLRLQDQPGSPVSEVIFAIDEPGELPAVVWERVESSIVVSQRLAIPECSGATAVARRRPDSEDIAWTIVFDDVADSTREDLRERARDALGELRTSLGI